MKNKKTLVLGASSKPNRYSFLAVKRLVENGYPVIAIGKEQGEVSGISIQNQKIPLNDVHTVTLYLNPSHQEEYYDYILEAKPKRVIFNPGTENPEFYRLLKNNDIQVEVACTLVMLASHQY